MRKITYLFLLIVGLGYSQDNEVIYVSNNQNVLLFFDDPILQGICGHSNYQFAFDVNEQKKYGIIKGQSGNDSNLHIITTNGNVYTFVLKYKSNVKKLNYFITSNDAVGNTNGTVIKAQNKLSLNIEPKQEIPENSDSVSSNDFIEDYTTPERDDSDMKYNKERNLYYQKFCSNLTSQPAYFKRFFTEEKGIVMHLEEISYNQNELYFKLRVVNKTSIDYEANFLTFSKVGKKNNKKSTSQSITIPTLYTYNAFKKVPRNSERVAIYVFKKFGINEDKVVRIELNEKQGERNIFLDLVDTDLKKF